MRVYLAGPMRGRTEYNFPLFHRVAGELEARGFKVYNPAAKESTSEGKPDKTLIPQEWGGQATTKGSEIRRSDFLDLLACTGLVLLPGWERSEGSKDEVRVAQVCGMAIFEYEDGLLREIEPMLEVRSLGERRPLKVVWGPGPHG